jgi:hypothetical protein
MAKLHEFYSDWEQYHGRKVIVGGLSCTLQVSVYSGIYPYPAKWISVFAEPTKGAKNTNSYRNDRAKLGDDWSFDVLESENVYVSVLQQLGS